jgi:signal transduction histidine kinase
MIEGVRWRLTAWYVGVLAVVLAGFAVVAYALLARSLLASVDAALLSLSGVAVTSLRHDGDEGQSALDSARSTVAELTQGEQQLAVYDGTGQLLARSPDDDAVDALALRHAVPAEEPALVTVTEEDDPDDRHRVVLRRVRLGARDYVIAASQSLEAVDDELETLRETLLQAVPIALVVAGVGGLFLARQSLRPIAAAFRQQRQFMADASHELRTPLATIQTAALVSLQDTARPPADYRAALEIVASQARRLTRIVEDMFTLAQGDGRGQPLRRTRFYLDELVADAERAAAVLASAREVRIESRLEPDAAIDGDEELLGRLVSNLLDNAVKHSPAGATVFLELTREGADYRLSVRDQGGGIPEAAWERVFDRFFRVDGARARRGGGGTGAGLGLAIARWVAEAHGGRLDLVRSGRDGTTFAAVLPA